jgi:hypothetical protein
MDNYQLTRDMCIISLKLEGYWIDRIAELDSQGISLGNAEYDFCCGNLYSIASEFYVSINDLE